MSKNSQLPAPKKIKTEIDDTSGEGCSSTSIIIKQEPEESYLETMETDCTFDPSGSEVFIKEAPGDSFYPEKLESDTVDKVGFFTRRELYDMLRECDGKNVNEKLSSLKEKLIKVTKCSAEQENYFLKAFKTFKYYFMKKWSSAHRCDKILIKKYGGWLQVATKMPYSFESFGQSSKMFDEFSDSTSRNSESSEMILSSSPKQYTPQDALAMILECDFTKGQYEGIRHFNKHFYPSYSLIKRAKEECYLDKDSMQVNESCVEIQLQALLNHTGLRIYTYVSEVIETCSENEKENMVLISKWGCGRSMQSQFKQKFYDGIDSCDNIFQSSLVPMSLVVIIDGERKKSIWENPDPSSPKFCRPIRIHFTSKSRGVMEDDILLIENQIANLRETDLLAYGGTGKIKHAMLFTVTDGEVCKDATDFTSTSKCHICEKTSKDFNKIETLDINVDSLKFGLSILHVRIRFLELFLHLAYKLPLKKMQAQSVEEENIVKNTKEKIQNALKEEMYLLVDIPRTRRVVGNMSQRFFADAECSSHITGISLNLIKRFKVILELISKGNYIDAGKFDAFAEETSKLYTDLYGWYPMPTTVHKILIHGSQVVKHAILPIGILSEKADKARNKYFCKYQLKSCEKFSWIVCNRYVINRLLLRSDPYLSCLRERSKITKRLSSEALDLIIPTSPPHLLPDGDSDCNNDSEEEDFQSSSNSDYPDV